MDIKWFNDEWNLMFWEESKRKEEFKSVKKVVEEKIALELNGKRNSEIK